MFNRLNGGNVCMHTCAESMYVLNSLILEDIVIVVCPQEELHCKACCHGGYVVSSYCLFSSSSFIYASRMVSAVIAIFW